MGDSRRSPCDHDLETPAFHVSRDTARIAVMFELRAGVFHIRTTPLLEHLELTRHIQTEGDITEKLHGCLLSENYSTPDRTKIVWITGKQNKKMYNLFTCFQPYK